MKLTIKDDDSVQIELDQSGTGNPNYVETIDGTVFNPFGDYVVSELAQEVEAGNITVIMQLYYTSNAYVTTPLLSRQQGHILVTNGFADMDNQIFLALSLTCSDSGVSLVQYTSFTESADVTEMYADNRTVLTIIHHPLPEISNNEEE